MAYHKPLPAEILALQEELKNWPMITAEAQQAQSFEEALGIIAARLRILLDGMYDPLDLCKMLTKKLYDLRTTNIVLPDPKMKEVIISENGNTVRLDAVPDVPLMPASPSGGKLVDSRGNPIESTPPQLTELPKKEDSSNQEVPPRPLSSSCSDSEET